MLSFKDNNHFPPVETAGEDGLLAYGGNLSIPLLLEAYSKGIFPWYNEDEPIQWWSPDPRCVLFPDELKVSTSMKRILKKDIFSFKINTAFNQVMENCAAVERVGQEGTWIHQLIIESYTELHRLGFAHSAECWHGNKLVGGLYGIKLGQVFFGESMFALESNASKFALINFIEILQKDGIKLIDCQVETGHLKSLGARLIPRSIFKTYL